MKKLILFIIRYLYAALCCLYTFTFGIYASKNRFFLFKICDFYGNTFSLKPRIPKVNYNDIHLKPSPIYIYDPVNSDGEVSLFEIIVINQFVKSYNPSKIFEIGTFEGRTTLNMAANTSEQASLFTLDLPITKAVSSNIDIEKGDRTYVDKHLSKIGFRYLKSQYSSKITQLYGNSMEYDFSKYYNTIDFIFIDGGHTYEIVTNDSLKAVAMLKNKQGIILWHDYGIWDGVTKALNELYVKEPIFKGLKQIEGTYIAFLVLN